MIENLAPFARLVLVAHVGGKADATAALGSGLFFVARFTSAIMYTIGIPVSSARSSSFGISIVGEAMILMQILRSVPARTFKLAVSEALGGDWRAISVVAVVASEAPVGAGRSKIRR